MPPPSRGRPAVALLIAGAVALALVAVCGAVAVYLFVDRNGSWTHEGMGPPERDAGSPVELRLPLEFFPVADQRPGDPCPPGYLPDDTRACILPGSGGFRVARLDAIKAVPPEASSWWGVEIRLTGDDARAFARLTKRAAAEPSGGRIAILVDERVVSAPRVTQPIPDGEIMISGPYSRAEVDDLIESITGG